MTNEVKTKFAILRELKPKCPYCNSKMKIFSLISGQYDDLAEYKCEECKSKMLLDKDMLEEILEV